MTTMRIIGRNAAKVAFLASATLGGLSLVSTSVFASLSATATNVSGGSVNTGTLKLTQAPSAVVGITGGFVTDILNLAPGDTVNRYVDLTNGGTLDGNALTLTTVASTVNALSTNGTTGLQVTIKHCAIAWTAAGVCTPGSTTALAQTSVLALGSAQTLVVPSLVASAVNRLQISVFLPVGTEVSVNGVLPGGTIQGLTTALTWTFLETLRASTTTNS
jgi:hypothetical protein